MVNQVFIQIPYTKPTICVKSNDHVLLEWIFISYIPFSQKKVNDSPDIQLSITIKKRCGIYYLQYNEQKIITEDVNKIMGKVCHLINCLVTTIEPYIGLHCAVLAKNNINYLLVGPTGIGKSTLAMYLSENGYQYYTDDSVLINCNDKTLIPFVKNIHLRETSCEILEKYNIEIDKRNVYLGKETRYCQSRMVNELKQSKNIGIIFLKRDYGGEVSFCALNQKSALENIIANIIFLKDFEKAFVYALKLVSTTPCFELRYRKLDDAKRLLDLIGEEK